MTKPWQDWRWFAGLAALLIAIAFVAIAWAAITNANKLATNADKLQRNSDKLAQLVVVEHSEEACLAYVGNLVRAGDQALMTPNPETMGAWDVLSKNPPPNCVGT